VGVGTTAWRQTSAPADDARRATSSERRAARGARLAADDEAFSRHGFETADLFGHLTYL